MNTLVLVLGILFAIALVAIIVITVIRRSLYTALASLIAIMGGMVAGITAPYAEGAADINLRFGPFGHITAHWIRINPPETTTLWIPAFLTVGFLIFFVIYCLHKQKMAGL
jgi:hypothetical protein